MTKLFYEGGPLFMGILSLILIAAITMAVYFASMILKNKSGNGQLVNRLGYLKSIGLFGLVVGVFAQLLGLYEAFHAIQQMEDVAPSMLAGGLRVSMITNLYGVFIFLLSYLMWFGLVFIQSRLSDK